MSDAEIDLASRCLSLPKPKNLFQGMSSALNGLPHNILVFHQARRFGGRRGAHHHRFVMITCLKAGAAVVLDGRFYFLEPYSGLLVFPYQRHDYAQFKNSDILWMFVTFEFSDPSVLESLRNVPYRITEKDRKLLNETVAGYLSAHSGRKAEQEVLTFRLGELLARLVRRTTRYSKRKSNAAADSDGGTEFEVVRKAVAYVHEQIEGKISIADVAEHVSLSESRLRAIFRDMVGQSLGNYILEARITRACTLLHQSAMNISEISLACGFESLYAFSRAFKKRRMVSPSAYRKSKP